MTRKSPSPSDQLIMREPETPVRAAPIVAEDSYFSPTIKNELEIHLSRSWLRENVPHHLLRYIDEAPSAIQLHSRNTITVARLRNLHPQKLDALMIQAYGEPQPSACHRCAEVSPLKKVSRSCTVLDDVAQGACGNCVWQHENIRCKYHPSFTTMN